MKLDNARDKPPGSKPFYIFPTTSTEMPDAATREAKEHLLRLFCFRAT